MLKTPHTFRKNNRFSLLLILLVFNGISFQLAAQNDSLKIEMQGVAVYSSDELVPLWIHTNQFGRIDQFGHGQILGRTNSVFKRTWQNKLSLSAGVDLWMDNTLKHVTAGQIYAEAKYQNFSVIAGKKNLDYLPGQESEPVFLNFKNIRPMPAFSLGFFNYTPVPFTKNYVQFRGAFLLGKLNDHREAPGITNPWYHFKNLYLKSGNLPVNIFAGFNHSVLFGGTMSDGTKIPVDWLSTFSAQSSEKVGEFMPGEGVNTPGEHVAFSEIGVELETKDLIVSLSKHDPFTDFSGWFRSKDKLIHLAVQLKKENWIEKFSYQYGYTKHQSGPGLHLKSYKNIDDYSAFLKDKFGLDVEINSWEEFYPYLVELVNQGHPEFGRDNYFNHGLYKLGHFYDEHFWGFPLMHSDKQISYFKNIDDMTYRKIGNNRLQSHHFTASGTISAKLKYRAKATFTKNFGTYSGFYTSGFNERPNYYFKEGKNQNYFLLEFFRQLPRNFSANVSFGFDSGDLYDSFGIKGGLLWSISPTK
ncbi:hypothetical protein SAMN05444274_1115 [Mariniphaga anaerophila]|uniref:Capsule assembly protein Wzi n=1 Tax=Mariniphaga anaerophila TaxID=1484053 RepID=A0A1M5F3S2_9BACT|nr:hypothetical protein [Mariniphaga anaerophila]SHF86164.1 hypothetical protein SAMN05444274_1115 [Mariniphaga anaerophila]